MTILCNDNKTYNLYTLIYEKGNRIYTCPILSQLEIWKLRTYTKINLSNKGYTGFKVPNQEKQMILTKNTKWKITS